MFDKIKDIYSFARATLNRTRFVYNYYVLPIFFVLGFIDLVTIFLMMVINPNLFIPCLIMFLVFIFVLCGLFCILPFIRKEEIKEETARLNDFFNSKLVKSPEREYVLPKSTNDGTIPLIFSQNGLEIDKKMYQYDDFDCALFTSNYMYHANLILVFTRKKIEESEKNDEKVFTSFSLPLDINTLTLMNQYNIKLVNEDVLTFIKDNTEIAVKQILKYGKIQNDYDKLKEPKKKKEKVKSKKHD